MSMVELFIVPSAYFSFATLTHFWSFQMYRTVKNTDKAAASSGN